MLPALIISNLIELQIKKLSEMYLMVFFSIIIFTVSIFISLIFVKALRLKNKDKGAIILLSSFHNAIFLPFPIILSIFDNIAYAIFYACTSNIACLSIGTILAAYYGFNSMNNLRIVSSIIKFPPFLALFVALLMISLGIKHEGLAIMLKFIGKPTSYLMLLFLGMKLPTKASFSKLFIPLTIVAFIRFFVSPFLGFLLSSAFYLNEVAKGSLIIEASMPPALMNLMIISKYRLNMEMSLTIILLTTIISLIIIYLLMLIIL